MFTNSERIIGIKGQNDGVARPLFTSDITRALEASAALQLAPHTLMQRAGLALAQLTMALAPHARVIWIACGPGNNGGDGYEAARHLKMWGKNPIVTFHGDPQRLPQDATKSRQNALQAGVVLQRAAPDAFDFCVDALFGIGAVRTFDDQYTNSIHRINAGTAPVLAVDVPSGLDADSGAGPALHVKADFTLSLLTLKPGLFTADGRQACGEIWFNALGVDTPTGACARLNATAHRAKRAHNTHKGSYGEVCVVGGSAGMTGAALLAARGALHGGAGRVYVALLEAGAAPLDICQPELMFRELSALAYESMVVVAGCGGGQAIDAHLPDLLRRAGRLVLDADALNAIARDTQLEEQLVARRGRVTVLTPHPLEAARLLKVDTATVQSNRLGLAQAIAERFGCTVALKGSGTIIAASGVLACINTSGNAHLATAGTGDVLAGMVGANLATGADAFKSACEAVYRHGQIAEEWTGAANMTAQDLARRI